MTDRQAEGEFAVVTADEQRLKALLAQYARLAVRAEKLTDGSFDDVKLLAAIGVVFGSTPVAEYLGGSSALLKVEVRFAAFVAAFALLTAIAFRDLLKQSLIHFQLYELNTCVSALANLDSALGDALDTPARWQKWENNHYSRAYRGFILAAALPAVVLPTAALRDCPSFSVGYATLAVVTAVLYCVHYRSVWRPPGVANGSLPNKPSDSTGGRSSG